VVFLDEPFEAIDPVTSVTIQRLLAAIAGRGITVFLATHILSAVERLATQFVLIRHGKIAWNSPAAEIFGSLEDHYFDLIEATVMDDLTWLGSRGS
jgi:ABC-2 type transport system ATP-binding protein